MSNNKPRRGIFSRIGGYGATRIRDQHLLAKSRKNFTSAISAIGEAMTPVTFDRDEIRKGLDGRYSDGGRQRFEAEMARRKLTDIQLDKVAFGHVRIALIFMLAAACCFGLAAWWMFSGYGLNGFIYGIAVFVAVLVFVAMSVRHDYSAWQIRQRRFGGFRDYLQSRLG